ncbi:MAG: ribosome small subunit-dependent GTPase A [Marinilabiliales bacterium]|nr:MAG: ribosome small subunit-dependent GTPase A [Marinilabiliales bacterium]
MKKGIVTKSTGSWYSVKDNETGIIVSCNIRGKLRIQGIRSTNPVAVGDFVEYELQENSENGVIKNILDRKNYIIRKSTNLSKQTHILAANLDQAILMITIAFPETYTIFIDLFLITAEAYRIPAKLIFNKIDLYNQQQKQYLNELIDIYQKAGYECFSVSVKENINVSEITQLLKNKISLLAGNSGVGKSSLINMIDPGIQLKTSEISDYHKSGKHTTTFAEMFELSVGGYVIDTPGIRGFGLHDIHDEELFHFFPEIFKASENCKYHNCTHQHEPGCAVKIAIEKGTVSQLRYENYLNILFDEESKHR